jgi:hypothetical protein
MQLINQPIKFDRFILDDIMYGYVCVQTCVFVHYMCTHARMYRAISYTEKTCRLKLKFLCNLEPYYHLDR